MRITREFFQIIAGNRNLAIAYFLLLPVFWIGSMSLVLKETQQLSLEYSRSDLLLLSFNEGGFSGIVFVFLILCFIMYLFRFDPEERGTNPSKLSVTFTVSVPQSSIL